jgi:Ser/Thr protein kinase RdoA (MazF antagonist)
MTATTKAHGMDGSLVAPDWPPLTLEEVRTLLRQFQLQFPGCDGPIEILSVSPRPFSAASVVKAGGKHVFIKRHHLSVRDKEGLLEEHRFLDYLWTHGADVPRVLANASGESAIEYGEWTYEVHETPAGIDLYGEAISWTPFRSAGHARAAGKALARLHQSAHGFDKPARKRRPLVASFTIFAAEDVGAEMDRFRAARPALASYFEGRDSCAQALELLAPFHDELLPLMPSLAPLWTHNDLHASNLFWSDTSNNAQATAVIDFGLADRTNAVHDIAHAIERNIVEWLTLVNAPAHPEAVTVHFDHLHALLEGYEQVRPLSDEEAAALAPMTALCHAEEKAPMAADGWLVGHARWFRSAAGSRLLDALRRWADARKPDAARTSGAARS